MDKIFDPVETLEAIGIDNFKVDYQTNIVHLSKRDLLRLIGFIRRYSVLPVLPIKMAESVQYRGWQFEPVPDLEEASCQ